MEGLQKKFQEYIDGISKQTQQLLSLSNDVQDIKNWIAKSPQLTAKMSGVEDQVSNLGKKHNEILNSVNSISTIVNKQQNEIIPGMNKAITDADKALKSVEGTVNEINTNFSSLYTGFIDLTGQAQDDYKKIAAEIAKVNQHAIDAAAHSANIPIALQRGQIDSAVHYTYWTMASMVNFAKAAKALNDKTLKRLEGIANKMYATATKLKRIPPP